MLRVVAGSQDPLARGYLRGSVGHRRFDLLDRSDRFGLHIDPGAFMHAKLGDALESRGVAPHIYESEDEAASAVRATVPREE